MRKYINLLTGIIFALAAFSFSQAQAADIISQGTFAGRSDHITTGKVEVIKNSDGSYKVILGEDFSLDGAPDPKLAFGHDGINKNTLFSPLKHNSGKQEYLLPASIDPAQFNEIYVWCEKFDVPLGVASLK
ncbi:DM13 domain-containing protein [Kiloniella laminariae]|uniref:DM13 domain-containing protein n=1 Tax=Kiloniella laminariae TaxID=454162 RepID=A0ABT4LDJ9_9PROT|nr:DM13 domain-containing protein [Kiloniella laminariae]MCZ4279167.1 DM13 domain-containing protein [Kiloniella laminariae]